MGIRKPETPNSIIRQVLRGRIWLRSRERAAALKRDKYSCQICGVKQSRRQDARVDVEVHHLDNSGIDAIIELIRKTLLCSPDRLQTVCKACHKEMTDAERANGVARSSKGTDHAVRKGRKRVSV